MRTPASTLASLALVLALAAGCDEIPPEDRPYVLETAPTGALAADDERVARGRYLVTAAGCGDCHTPLTMGPSGPTPDTARLLSGHPEALEMPPAPALPEGPWNTTVSASMTAWSGPWGTSFTANLTPDPETGLGRWTEDDFVATIRNGRHLGVGRPLLPPMPVTVIANYSDDDLRAIFSYLRTIPAVQNHVPRPIPPATAAARAALGESETSG